MSEEAVGVAGEVRLTVWEDGRINVTGERDNEAESATYDTPLEAIEATAQGVARALDRTTTEETPDAVG